MDQLFSTKHLIAILIGIVVVTITLLFLNKKKWSSEKLMIITAVLFYIFEVLKQGYWIYSGIFSVHKLPLYPCNMPLYIFPFLIFGTDRMKEFIKPFLYVIFLGGGLLALIYPSIILGTSDTWTVSMQNFVPFISIIVHSLMIALGVYLVSSGFYKIRKYDYIRIFVTIFSMYVAVYIFNQLVGTDFFFSNEGNGLPGFLLSIKEFSIFIFASIVFLTGLLDLYVVYWITLLINKKKEYKFSYKEQ